MLGDNLKLFVSMRSGFPSVVLTSSSFAVAECLGTQVTCAFTISAWTGRCVGLTAKATPD